MGKKAVLIVVAVTLAVLIFGWYFLQNVMINFDVDHDTSQPELNIAIESANFERV